MYFGTDYYPEHWVYPYAGTPKNLNPAGNATPELMVACRHQCRSHGEFAWGLYEPEEGKYDFDGWQRRGLMANAGLQVMLGTPTAAPPIWLARKHAEILPLDENGLPMHEGTRKAYCMNSSVYWDYCKKIITQLANALGRHPQLIAWQIDNGLGGHDTESSFNEETRRIGTRGCRPNTKPSNG